MPLTYTLKMVKVVNFMLCLFSHGESIIYLYYWVFAHPLKCAPVLSALCTSFRGRTSDKTRKILWVSEGECRMSKETWQGTYHMSLEGRGGWEGITSKRTSIRTAWKCDRRWTSGGRVVSQWCWRSKSELGMRVEYRFGRWDCKSRLGPTHGGSGVRVNFNL